MFSILVRGLLVIVLAVVLLAATASAAGRATSKFVGLSEFRVFGVKAKGALARELVVYLACVVAVMAVCAGLVSIGVFIDGQSEASTRVEVMPESPAQLAGLTNGDRIVAVDGVPVHKFDLIWAAVHRSSESHVLTVERNGNQQDFSVTPDARGAVGVTAIMETRRPPVSEALWEGVRMPFRFWSKTTAEKVDLVGPLRLTRAIARERAGVGSYFTLLGIFVCSLCWTIPAAFVNDWLTWALLKWRHPTSLQLHVSHPQTVRVSRLHHALKSGLILFALSAVVLVVAVALFDLSKVPIRALFAWFDGAFVPIVWLLCLEFRTRTKAAVVTLFMLVPLVNVGIVIGLMRGAKRWLNKQTATRPS